MLIQILASLIIIDRYSLKDLLTIAMCYLGTVPLIEIQVQEWGRLLPTHYFEP